MWQTPIVLTWESWLARQWRNASQQGRVGGGLQLLNPAQETALWEFALRQLPAEDPELLPPHAASLMRAASLANQSLLSLHPHSAATEEEQLLIAALGKVRSLCRERGLVSLAIAAPEDLGFLAGSPAPRVVGQPALTALQRRLQELFWPAESLLVEPGAEPVAPSLLRAAHPDEEIAACARWCRAFLEQDAAARLLVVSCRQESGAQSQAASLWREFAGNVDATDEQRRRLLAVEGGESLARQALVQEAMAALSLADDRIEGRVLLQLLRSPYFLFGSASECAALQRQIGAWGLARWSLPALNQALTSVASHLPAAGRLLSWCNEAHALLGSAPRSATGWAGVFSRCLEMAGFPAGRGGDSRDMQRLSRWGELLDEFAGLDAVLAHMDGAEAVRALQRLARDALHQAATADAAITFTTQLHDPVVGYDGIWIMGLTESRWPAPPRPDPYVPLHEQRRCGWPQAGATQQLQAARWLLERWSRATPQLVLSHARLEGDVHHRPTALMARAVWADAAAHAVERPPFQGQITVDRSLPPMRAEELVRPLRGGISRLRLQQECPFHAQAEWRLRAEPPAELTDGIPARLRGMLLHSLLEGIWGELRQQRHLLALTPEEETRLFDRHWRAAISANAAMGADWIAPAVLERERLRARGLVGRVLEMDRGRPDFEVRLREHALPWRSGAAQLDLRIDRVDHTAAGEALIVDYKSGDAGTIHLQEGEARPLQLALYVAALAQQGQEAGAALLLSLKPARLEYAGVSRNEAGLPGRVKSVADWGAALQSWESELHALVSEHLAGSAALAESTEPCRHCHLPAFCRRRGAADAAMDEEGANE